MTRRDAREREARRAGYPEYDGMTPDQLMGERRSLSIRQQEMGRLLHDLRIRSEHLKLRIRAAREGDSGVGISDHAVLRYLERVKGLDVNAVRAEIRARVAKLPIDRAATDQVAVDDGVSFAVSEGETVATIWIEPS